MDNTRSEGIHITLEDIAKAPKDWVTTHLESKGKPVWTRTVDIDGHIIELTNYDETFIITETHNQELVDFVRQARELNPEIITNFRRLIFDDYQPQSRYADEERFPFNGTRLEDGVLLYKRGLRTDLIHRTGKVSNFQGTVAHECFHFIDREYDDAWKEAFDWHYVGDNIAEWEHLPGKTERIFRNKGTGWIAYEGQYTNHPEHCVTDYARLAWDDDFADSGVVSLFEPERMNQICSRKLDFIRGTKKTINTPSTAII